MRVAWVLTAAATLAACGSVPASSSETLPTSSADTSTIEVSADSEMARMLGPDTPAELFTAVAGLDYPAGRAGRWEMTTEPSTDDEALLLAGLLGVPGNVTPVGDGFGPGLMVGSPESDGGTLIINSFAEPHWYLQRLDDFLVEAGAIPCPTLPFDDPDAGKCANGIPSSPEAAPDDAVIDTVVTGLMAGLGLPFDSYRTGTVTSGSIADVSIEFSPDGLRTDVTWSLGISGSGDVTSGSGPLRPPVLVDEVATVSLDEALVRLSRVSPGVPVIAVPPPSTTALAVTTTGDPATDVVVTVRPVPTPRSPFVLPTITGIEPGLASVWDVTNRKWLVPAIVVTGDQGFVTSIPVISADLITVVDPGRIQVPVRTGPPLTVPTAPSVVVPPPTRPVPPGPETSPSDIPVFYSDILNELLVGEPLDSAWTRLLDAGWEVRSDDLDDPTETFEADLRIGRATIEHRGITVVAIIVG